MHSSPIFNGLPKSSANTLEIMPVSSVLFSAAIVETGSDDLTVKERINRDKLDKILVYFYIQSVDLYHIFVSTCIFLKLFFEGIRHVLLKRD